VAVYRKKYILQGLKEITPEMEKDLDLAYGVCMEFKEEFHCEMCGKCCHQPNIIVLPEEVDRISASAGIPLYDFITKYLERTSDGRMLFKKKGACAFLGPDNRCKIWKDRPEVCDEFPCSVSMFMSRIYLAITNDDSDIFDMISYMDDSWPCTKMIKSNIKEKVDRAKETRSQNGCSST